VKNLYQKLLAHLKEDFRLSFYVSFGVFIGVCLYLNYRWDFEDSIIDSYQGTWLHPLYFFLFYGFAYLTIVLLYAVCYRSYAFLKSSEFWIKIILGLTFLSLRSGFPLMEELLGDIMAPGLKYWAYRVVKNLLGIPLVIVPLLALWYYFDRKESHRYGWNTQSMTWRPYLLMLALMVPIIGAASFLNNFSSFYPMYKSYGAHYALGVDEWVTVAGYELVYGLNFIVVEYFFRGFLVLAMAKFLGRGGILAMVSLYCFFHFGKPEGEAISSIFGGYILGVIAYYSKNIWGGVLLHVGIAWMMELAAYLQKL
jgi:hypothetical protein